eukprot:jgi/Astpho2/6276/Aster-x1364
MTQLLRKWLVEEVGSPDAGPSLEQNTENLNSFMQHFANGYWLGEMLSKLDLQPDFDHFEDRRTPDAMLKNYARLQPTFTKLHVPFTSQTAKQLMRGDKGAAAQLLYGIKSAVDRDGGADSVGPNPTKLAATFGFKMPLSRGLLESNGYRQAASAALQATYEEGTLHQFEDNLVAAVGSRAAQLEQLHLHKYAEEAARQAREAAKAAADSQAATVAQRNRRREELLSSIHNRTQARLSSTDQQLAVHSALRDRQAGLEKADLRVEVSVQEHRRLKKQLAAQRATLDASGGKLWHQMCQLASSAP